METIYSLVTKPINQNIAVIRISGPDSFVLLNKVLKQKFEPKANFVGYNRFYINNEFVDEGLVLSFLQPNSFTGENVVEIQTHGSMEVVEMILLEFSKYQDIARPANPGEFTKQAFLNKKLDLSKANAINNLILYENQLVSKKAMKNISGEQTKYIDSLVNKLEAIIAKSQVNIDYPENTDLEEFSNKKIESEINNLFEDINSLIIKSDRIQRYINGIKVAIIGEPNAGKSTLINTILGEDRIIVSDIKGTTRDVIDINIKIDGIPIILRDTAGIRKHTDDKLELIGIEKSQKTIKESDIIIYLQPKNCFNQKVPEYLEQINKPIIKVLTKKDLDIDIDTNLLDVIQISSVNNDIDSLIDALKEIIKKEISISSEDENFLIDKLQLKEFKKIRKSLENVIFYIKQGYTTDYFLFEIEDAIQALYKLIGKVVDPDYINNLFGGFCLGK